MRILLDECIDRRLARDLKGHDVKTVPEAGWAGIDNGRLLELAEGRFDIFITVDRNLSFQQDLLKFHIARAGIAGTNQPTCGLETAHAADIRGTSQLEAWRGDGRKRLR